MRKVHVLSALAAVFVLAACDGARVGDPAEAPARKSDTTLTPEVEVSTNSQSDSPPKVDETLKVLGIYKILPGDSLRGNPSPEQVAVFQRFTQIIPSELRPEVTHFVAIDQVASGGVDGALRHPVDKNGNVDYGRQYIALDTTGSATGETLDRTIVHELGHLLTLGKGQITEFTPAQLKAHEQVECEVYSTPECPAAGSYLYDYFTTFDYAEDAPYDDTEYPSQYATTLPTEDVAEIFAEWVLNDAAPFTVTDDGVDRTVNPGSVLQEKLHFFDAYPEVIEIRNKVREGLGLGCCNEPGKHDPGRTEH